MKLKVLKSYVNDRYNIVARIDYDTMKALGISDNDIIEISGNRKTVAKCLPLNPSDFNHDSISLSEMVMENTKSKEGDIVEISRISPVFAREINFSSPVNIPPIDQKFFSSMLEGYPVSKGDELVVPYFADEIFLNILLILPELSGYATVISKDTTFRYTEKKNNENSSNFYTVESLDSHWNKYAKLLNKDTKSTLTISKEKNTDQSFTKHKVFIIHGHDMQPVYELERLLVKEFNLQTIILKDQAGRNRTLIEKFVEETRDIRFAFAILTPDDIIKLEDGEYAQARPNVIYELGYFGGKIGRENTCIMLKKNTKIHSDLDGVSRIEFDKNIEDKFLEIKRELLAAGIITS